MVATLQAGFHEPGWKSDMLMQLLGGQAHQPACSLYVMPREMAHILVSVSEGIIGVSGQGL